MSLLLWACISTTKLLLLMAAVGVAAAAAEVDARGSTAWVACLLLPVSPRRGVCADPRCTAPEGFTALLLPAKLEPSAAAAAVAVELCAPSLPASNGVASLGGCCCCCSSCFCFVCVGVSVLWVCPGAACCLVLGQSVGNSSCCRRLPRGMKGFCSSRQQTGCETAPLQCEGLQVGWASACTLRRLCCGAVCAVKRPLARLVAQATEGLTTGWTEGLIQGLSKYKNEALLKPFSLCGSMSYTHLWQEEGVVWAPDCAAAHGPQPCNDTQQAGLATT